MRKWSEQSAISTINHDGFAITGKFITKQKGSSSGLKKLSAIDYLCNYCGYKFNG
jgi:hypothetical protein